MLNKIKSFYTGHKDEIHGAAFVALGGLLVTGGVLLGRSNKKVADLQKFHDDIYNALKSGFGVVLDTEDGDNYLVKLVEPVAEALEESTDAA